MTQHIEAIIFDLDGTLVDSESPGLDVLHEVAVKLGVMLTGLLPWFNKRLFCAYEVGFWKSDPQLFLPAALIRQKRRR